VPTESGFGGVPAEHYLRASRAADAILYDGYQLRPGSRRGVANDRPRRVGVLTPKDWAEENLPLDTGIDGTVESWFARTEVVAECPPETSLTVRLRFLQAQRRTVERYIPGTGFVPAARLDVDGWVVTSADEAIPHERDLTVDLDSLRAAPAEFALDAISSTEFEMVRDSTGAVRGRIRRTCRSLQVRTQVAAVDAGLVVPMMRIRVVVENVTKNVPSDMSPAMAMEHSLIATHCFLGLSGGGFASLLNPPPFAVDAVAECTNIHAFPVLAGEGGRDDLMLSAPVVLADYPRGEPVTLGEELDAAGAAPATALPLPITPATYPTGPLAVPAPSSERPHWVTLRPA
jgi:hypothetical protein